MELSDRDAVNAALTVAIDHLRSKYPQYLVDYRFELDRDSLDRDAVYVWLIVKDESVVATPEFQQFTAHALRVIEWALEHGTQFSLDFQAYVAVRGQSEQRDLEREQGAA